MSEKMIVCKACQQPIAKSAKVCPHCGAKNKKGSPIWLGAIALVILIVIISSAGGNDEPKKVGDYSSTTSTTAPASQNTKTSFLVGEIAALKDVEVTLIEVTESNGSTYNKPTDGNVFVLCEFEIANNSDEEIVVSSILSFEGYCDDYACNYSFSALLEKGNKNQLDGTIAPGKKFKGVIGFEVPADWQELEVHFTPDFWNGKDITFIATNN